MGPSIQPNRDIRYAGGNPNLERSGLETEMGILQSKAEAMQVDQITVANSEQEERVKTKIMSIKNNIITRYQ